MGNTNVVSNGNFNNIQGSGNVVHSGNNNVIGSSGNFVAGSGNIIFWFIHTTLICYQIF